MQPKFGHAGSMQHLNKKIFAVLLALWLPLGGLLAAEMPAHGACHEMSAMQGVHVHANQDADQKTCSCHQACCCYLGVQELGVSAAPAAGHFVTPYRFSFYSVSSIPLLPPPLRFI